MYDFKIQNVQLVCPQTNSMISTSTWGELNIVLNARRIELGTKLIFLHVWAKVMRRMQQPHSFHDSTCAIEPTGTPPRPKIQKSVRECTRWLSLFGETEIQIPFLPKTANIMNHGDTWKWIWSCQHLFLSQPQKSPDISLLQGFLRHGEFRFRTRRKTITSKPTVRPCHDPTNLSWSYCHCHLQWKSMISTCQVQSNKKFCKVQLSRWPRSRDEEASLDFQKAILNHLKSFPLCPAQIPCEVFSIRCRRFPVISLEISTTISATSKFGLGLEEAAQEPPILR